mmetsp:Transcript_42802/g.109518  ORF Transcript_42802/g.109518 Transcript_42802/m.109518 type:complete len:270 (+) Transcript_42802:346-1155(+)|eukprot:jgi/Tetstr1/425169/TSEL_015630.t1
MYCVFGGRRAAPQQRGECSAEAAEERDLLSPTKKLKTMQVKCEEEAMYSQLSVLAKSLPVRMRSYVCEELFGDGGNGIAYVESPHNTLVDEDGVWVYFSGELQRRPLSFPDDATFILARYKEIVETSDGCDITEASLASSKLGRLRGHYGFIIFDKHTSRIVAARDRWGTEPLFWGTSLFGEGLMFASDRSLIEEDCADADYFPAGTFFVSNVGDTNGNIGSFGSGSSGCASDSDASQTPANLVCSTSTGRLVSSTVPKVPSQSAIATK